MFSVYGLNGRVFNGTLEQWRRVGQVTAGTGAAALRPTGQDERAAARPGQEPEGEVQRGAIAAYARTQQGSAQRHPLMHASEVMSQPVVTVAHDAPVAQAWQQLTRHSLGQLPVVDGRGMLVGLLLRADLTRPEHLSDSAQDARDWRRLMAQRVGALMRTPVPSAQADTDIRRVTQVLLETGLPGLPVVDEQGLVTGFVSRSDILRAVVADPPLELWA